METTAPLGITTSYASTSDKEKRSKGRSRRWRIHQEAGKLLPNERVASCCRHIIPGKSGVPIVFNSKSGMAHYQNLMACGSVWACPICSSKISEKRRVELTEAVSRSGFSKIMVTFTLQHDRDDRLIDLRTALNDAFRRLKSGRIWQDFKEDYGLAASVAATEITWGKANGWHIHKHVLFFSTVPEADFDVDGFTAALIDRYTGLLAGSGHYASN